MKCSIKEVIIIYPVFFLGFYKTVRCHSANFIACLFIYVLIKFVKGYMSNQVFWVGVCILCHAFAVRQLKKKNSMAK